jgi:hypothetical protein
VNDPWRIGGCVFGGGNHWQILRWCLPMNLPRPDYSAVAKLIQFCGSMGTQSGIP